MTLNIPFKLFVHDPLRRDGHDPMRADTETLHVEWLNKLHDNFTWEWGAI